MKEMLLNMLRSMIPDSADLRVQFNTIEHEHGRTIAIKISDCDARMLADIAIEIPRGKS
ncbi:MAG: hypothetical protein ACJ8LM_17260 [Candidatus Udaeobacter sp.]